MPRGITTLIEVDNMEEGAQLVLVVGAIVEKKMYLYTIYGSNCMCSLQ